MKLFRRRTPKPIISHDLNKMKALVSHIETGNFEESNRLIEELIAEAPTESTLHFLLAKCYGNMGDAENKWKHYALAMAFDPHSPTTYRAIAKAFPDNKMIHDAVLEKGWQSYSALLNGMDREEAKKAYFRSVE